MNPHRATPMWRERNAWPLAAILLLSLSCLALGRSPSAATPLAGGFAGLGYLLVHGLLRFQAANRRRAVEKPGSVPLGARPIVRRAPADPADRNALVDEMLAQGRHALLLRPQIANTLSKSQFRRILESLNASMALVPEGEVVLGGDELSPYGCDSSDAEERPGRVVRVAPVFLDRHPVTNRQFYEFVAGGGYSQVALWDAAIWTAVLTMTDRSGTPGPRYWNDGVYPQGEDDYPVVGVSWYEAAAFARWTGKRLPSDAEWVKAGAWPLPTAEATRGQRRYPWGDAIDRSKANLWGSGPERVVSVREFAEGVSVGGVYQLIGNVWEWTGGTFRGMDGPDERLETVEPMKSLHGGAFDTYFDNQATCQFQSGDNPLRRQHNIGFRCAVGLCDIVLAHHRAAPEHAACRPPDPTGEADHEPAACSSANSAQEACA